MHSSIVVKAHRYIVQNSTVWHSTHYYILQSTIAYHWRHNGDIIMPFCRLSLTKESFIPLSLRLWNKTDLLFKKQILSLHSKATWFCHDRIVPKYFLYWPKSVHTYYLYWTRKLDINLTQLKCFSSFLNVDSFRFWTFWSSSQNLFRWIAI